MRKQLKNMLHKVRKDRLGNYHKLPCELYGRKITVIDNVCGKKVNEWAVKHCPFCGEKLKKD